MLNSTDIRKQNVAKYGERNDDIIARSYREGVDIGNVWCLKNAEKYIRRFLSRSAKGNNLIDLLKAKDYLDRAVEINQKLAKTDDRINKQEMVETIQQMTINPDKLPELKQPREVVDVKSGGKKHNKRKQFNKNYGYG